MGTWLVGKMLIYVHSENANFLNGKIDKETWKSLAIYLQFIAIWNPLEQSLSSKYLLDNK